MSDEQRVYQRGEAVPLWAEIKNWDGDYTDPDTGVKITITDPNGTVQVDAASMTKSATGIYYYIYESASDGTVGWWTAKGKAQHGTYITFKRDTFKLEE